jgi:transcription-repair coupling factor (superfamily II helicase)
MLEEAILEAKAGGIAEARTRDLSPQITVDAPILIPEEYVPDLDLRMSLYRRINDMESEAEIESFAAELIDRFGKLPEPVENLLSIMAVKLSARKAHIAKIDVGPRGALVSFWNDRFPNVDGLLAYVERLKGTAKLRPDMKLSIVRAWPDARARLHGIRQLSRGLAKLV